MIVARKEARIASIFALEGRIKGRRDVAAVRGAGRLLWPVAVLGVGLSNFPVNCDAETDEATAPDEQAACASVRDIEEYLSAQDFKLDADQVRPLVELFNALSAYQTFECDLPGFPRKEDYLPEAVTQDLLRIKEAPGSEREEKSVPVITQETVQQMQEVAPAGPPEFQSAVFHCVSDYERCNTFYVAKGQPFDAGLGCGVTFVVCVATQLIPK